MTADVMDLPGELGLARPEPGRLRQLVATAVGAAPQGVRAVTDVTVEKVDYQIGTPMTHALLRCRGTAVLDGGGHASDRQVPWSAFVKVLQSPWEWEHIDQIPAEFRADFADNVPWRLELDAYCPEVTAVLPDGFRQPRLYDIVEIDDRHVAIWMEDVEPSREPWDVPRFVHAAELLGRLAARRPIGTPAVLAPSALVEAPGFALRYYVGGRVRMGALPGIADDSLWAHPTVLAAVDTTGEQALRGDLLDAATRLDGWLDRLDTLPQTYCHGDASPQNLLVPADAPDTFVVIDWGFNSPHAVGFDLGQLLVGLAHARELPADELHDVAEAILPAYHGGLVEDGGTATLEQVRTGFVLSLAARSAFTALPIEVLGEPPSPAQTEYWVERIRLTRVMLDLAAELA
jgi:hypothetical protein